MLGNLQVHQFQEQMKLRGYAERTIRDYGLNVGYFINYLTDEEYLKEIDEVRQDHIRSYHIGLQAREIKGKPFSKKTIRTKMGAVKVFFKLMHEGGFIKENLEGCIAIPRIKSEAPKNIPSAKEIAEFLDSVVPDRPITIRDRTILELLYATGIRNGELRRLTIGDLDLQDQKLYIDKAKGGKNKVVPIGEWLVPFFSKYLNEVRSLFSFNGTNLLFPSKSGKQITQANLRDMVKKYAVRMGTAKRITPHTFRHCLCTHLLKAGLDIRYVQRVAGHADIKSTMAYTHLITDDLQEKHTQYHPRQKLTNEQ